MRMAPARRGMRRKVCLRTTFLSRVLSRAGMWSSRRGSSRRSRRGGVGMTSRQSASSTSRRMSIRGRTVARTRSIGGSSGSPGKSGLEKNLSRLLDSKGCQEGGLSRIVRRGASTDKRHRRGCPTRRPPGATKVAPIAPTSPSCACSSSFGRPSGAGSSAMVVRWGTRASSRIRQTRWLQSLTSRRPRCAWRSGPRSATGAPPAVSPTDAPNSGSPPPSGRWARTAGSSRSHRSRP
mmetsp:Transcript_179182/g.568573  ORF Transcript_179182/g.568573 Transcript_179182/m.568573 type:complete len:236 (+) Transcript_179182:242-949(+)